MPTPDLKTMRNATAKKAMSQEGVDPDQDLDLDADADRGSDADFTPDRDLGSLRRKAAKKALGGERADPAEEDTGDIGDRERLFQVDTGEGGGDYEDTGDTGDTGEGDRFGGTFGAERVEAVAVGQDWEDKVTDAVHGHREKLQHEDPQGDGGDYELVEAVGNPPTELIFESPNGQQYSVEYSTGEVVDVTPEQRTPYGGEGELFTFEDLKDANHQWSDTGDTGE